jgi:hypothetical protein
MVIAAAREEEGKKKTLASDRVSLEPYSAVGNDKYTEPQRDGGQR